MLYTPARSFLLLLLLFVIPVASTANAQQQAPDNVERQLHESFNKGDVQAFASLVDLIDQKQRDELLLYVLSQAKQSPIEFVRVLLDKGADVNQPRRYKTALMHAASAGYADVVTLLLARGAEVNVLVLAASLGHPGIVQLLLNKGADVNAKGLISGSEHGLTYGTALQAAEQANKPDVVALLRNVRHD